MVVKRRSEQLSGRGSSRLEPSTYPRVVEWLRVAWACYIVRTPVKDMHEGDVSTMVRIICDVGGLPELTPDQDFYDAGVSSVNALPLLMEIEERFQVSIPDDRFLAARTAQAMQELVTDLRKG